MSKSKAPRVARDRPRVLDAEGFAVIDGHVRVPCTGEGCTVVPYVSEETPRAEALCHACTVKRATAAKARRS